MKWLKITCHFFITLNSIFIILILILINGCRSNRVIQIENLPLPSEYANDGKSRLIFHTKNSLASDSTALFGHILDNFDFSPIGAATIVLKNRDTNETTGALTNFNGNFLIYPKPGNYNLEIQFIGYDSLKMENWEFKNHELYKILVGLKQRTDINEVEINTR